MDRIKFLVVYLFGEVDRVNKVDMSYTPELEKLYYALGDFIFKYFQRHCVVSGTMVSIDLVNMIRDASLESFKQIMETIDQKLIEGKECDHGRFKTK